MKSFNVNRNLLTLSGFKQSWFLSVLSTLPGLIGCVFLVVLGQYDLLEGVTILTAIFFPWLILLTLQYRSALRPWQLVCNILVSFREQDYSIRSAIKKSADVVSVVLHELNTISAHLSSNRIAITETQNLLGRILAEVDIAVFLFDDHRQLAMVNRFGAALYKEDSSDLIGQSLDDLGLTFAQRAAHTSVHEYRFDNRQGRWLVKHSVYRHMGKQHQLLMLTDIGKSLRNEELEAWRRLVRILSHEINNALTPLKTTTGSMARVLKRDDLLDDWQEDFKECLHIIDNRVDHLSRLVNSYMQLAKLPEPSLAKTSVCHILSTMARSYEEGQVQFIDQEDVSLLVDQAQIEQVLMNLIKNAIEASEVLSPVILSFQLESTRCNIMVDDSGCGVVNPDNLFVPYYSTKPQGSGIGLLVSRQIVEAHEGTLHLDNHADGLGCRACISLPLS